MKNYKNCQWKEPNRLITNGTSDRSRKNNSQAAMKLKGMHVIILIYRSLTIGIAL